MAQDLKEELEALTKRTAEEASRIQEAHTVELARLALERSNMEVSNCCETTVDLQNPALPFDLAEQTEPVFKKYTSVWEVMLQLCCSLRRPDGMVAWQSNTQAGADRTYNYNQIKSVTL